MRPCFATLALGIAATFFGSAFFGSASLAQRRPEMFGGSGVPTAEAQSGKPAPKARAIPSSGPNCLEGVPRRSENQRAVGAVPTRVLQGKVRNVTARGHFVARSELQGRKHQRRGRRLGAEIIP